MKLSILDLSPVEEDLDASKALKNSLELSELADDIGYNRYWFAEHHSMNAIATTTPEIMIAQVASRTKNLRVGSGGVMLPNHSPLKVAESFKTLLALFGDRIDLGLGRAPGTDMKTAMALRRSKDRVQADYFTEELHELREYLGEGLNGIKAMPETNLKPEIWLLGSSDFSANLAAKLGLPFSFADHFSPYPAKPIVDLYRGEFNASGAYKSPNIMLGSHIICAETDEEADHLALSSDYSFYQLRKFGKSQPLIDPTKLKKEFSEEDRKLMREIGMKKIVGSPETVKKQIEKIKKETNLNELIVTTFIYGQKERLKSYELLQKITF